LTAGKPAQADIPLESFWSGLDASNPDTPLSIEPTLVGQDVKPS
jgi:hypothetical protein